MFGFEFGGGSETVRLKSIIADQRRAIDARDIDFVLNAVKRAQGNGYAADVETIRRAYIGDQQQRIRDVLSKRYPRSHGQMPIVPVGVITETAALKATVYRKSTRRHLVADGEPLGADDPRQIALDKVVSDCSLDVTMHEAERIVRCARTVFIRHSWSKDEQSYGKQRMINRLFWPHHVWAVTRESASDRVSSSSILIAKIRTADAEAESVYEIWRRTRTDDGAPVITYQHVSGKGTTLLEPTVYMGADLPWTCLHDGVSQGELYMTPDRDLIATQDQINAATCDGWFRQALQSHKQLFVSGLPKKDGQTLAYGPDVIMSTDQPGVTATALDMQADSAWHDLIERHLVMYGRTEGMPVDAWWTKGGNPETAHALAIRNRVHDARRMEDERIFAAEESIMMRIIARIVDGFGNLSTTIDGPDVEYVTTFTDPRLDLEDAKAKSERVRGEYKDGLISIAEAREQLGRAVVEEDKPPEQQTTDDEGGISEVTTTEQDKNVAATLNELSLAIERLVRANDVDLLNATRAAYITALGASPVAPLSEIPTASGVTDGAEVRTEQAPAVE